MKLLNDAEMGAALRSEILKAASVGIIGHIHPDGDDVGSCLAMGQYVKHLNPEAEVRVFLEAVAPEFRFLTGADRVVMDFGTDWHCDLGIALDCGSPDRLGEAARYFEGADMRICLDHHVTNHGFGDLCLVKPDSSSTSEVIYDIMDRSLLDHDMAECLYLGILHDTGVFKHSNTKEATMQAAGAMIAKGVKTSAIIDGTFYKKTFAQNRILGQALIASRMLLDGVLIASVITCGDLQAYGVGPADTNGIIDQLRVTDGTEVAVLLYELRPGTFKVSMRSNESVDVCRIAQPLGGGGHARAAGCTLEGDAEEILEMIAGKVKEQLS